MERIVQLKVYVPQALHRALKVRAAQSGTPMGKLVEEALSQFLKRRGAK